MKVKALSMGYYGYERRREGDVFEIGDDEKLGRWMELAGEDEELDPGQAARDARVKSIEADVKREKAKKSKTEVNRSVI